MKETNNMDPRVKRTHKFLRDALMSLILEKDYSDITVGDITARATLNRATFYLHYRDKHDLMKQSTDELLKELTENLSLPDSEYEHFNFLGDEPHPTFIRLFEQIAEQSDYYLVMLEEKIVPHFSSKIMDILVDAVANGLRIIMPDDQKLIVPREMAEQYIASAFLGVIIWWLKNDRPYTPEYMATQLTRLANRGLYAD